MLCRFPGRLLQLLCQPRFQLSPPPHSLTPSLSAPPKHCLWHQVRQPADKGMQQWHIVQQRVMHSKGWASTGSHRCCKNACCMSPHRLCCCCCAGAFAAATPCAPLTTRDSAGSLTMEHGSSTSTTKARVTAGTGITPKEASGTREEDCSQAVAGASGAGRKSKRGWGRKLLHVLTACFRPSCAE